MIVPMRKLSLLIFYKDYQQFLEGLREQGVVHIHEDKKRSAEDEELRNKMSLLKRISELNKQMTKRSDGKKTDEVAWKKEWEDAADPVERLKICYKVFDKENRDVHEGNGVDLLVFWEQELKQISQIEQQIIAFEKDKGVYEPWGDLPVSRIECFSHAGWNMRFFVVPEKKYMSEWEEKYNAVVVNTGKGLTYFFTLQHKGEEEKPDADLVQFPPLTATEISNQIELLRAEQEKIEAHLGEMADCAVDYLKTLRRELLEETDVLKVKDAARSLLDEKVVALEGWLPETNVDAAERWLTDQGVAYELSIPQNMDNPPILLKNNRFARLFEFIGELYSLPNYREMDLTPFFAPFFVLFFGFCLGDAGYGLLILLGITLYKPKAKKDLKPILSLAQWLGFSTVIMGIVGGTFFGISLLDAQWPWLEKIKGYMLDSQQLFNLALVIGVVQIIFGMFLKVANLWKQYGFSSALSTIGWLVGILGGGICYWLSEQGTDVTILTYVVSIIAGLLIFVFNNVKRNVFINIGSGLWDSYNMLTGLLGDTLSYIRLFALGISSAVLGLVFNDLALNMSGDIPVLKQLLMLVILVFGHGVNLFMAGLGSFVHPMRLTFVEFYKNAGFEGGGKKYQPFKKREL